MNMKKFWALMLSLAMALSLAACGGDSGSSDGDAANDAEGSGDKVVRIGVFEPATGDSGPGGKQEMLGMQYANQETPTVDIGGETYTVELVYADNGSDSSKAITAASELVSKDVSLVLGSYGSGVSIAAGPTFDEAGLAAIGVTCTNPQVTPATTTTSASASWTPSRARSLQTSRRRSSPPRRRISWASWATSMIRA